MLTCRLRECRALYLGERAATPRSMLIRLKTDSLSMLEQSWLAKVGRVRLASSCSSSLSR